MTPSEFWDAYEAAMNQEDPANPKTLPKGASARVIADAEKAMAVKLPPAVKQFYKRHDRSATFCIEPWINGGGPQYFMAIKDMVRTWKLMCKIGADMERTEPDYGFGKQEGPIKRNYWNCRWIPFAENQCGDNIYIDLDPADGGNIGQVVDWWHETALSKLISPGFAPWLAETADAIAKGKMKVIEN
jgi:cell wall assembly regulator SMI1